MKFTKPSLTIDQQLQLLADRWLRIENADEAKRYLEHIGYFRLSGYFKPFQNSDDRFLPNSSFEEILDIYVFDRKLRLLTLDAIEKVEISLKAVINEKMTASGWIFWYLNPENFELEFRNNAKIYADFLDLAGWFAKNPTKHALFVEKYFEKYVSETHLPSWMLLEEMTIGNVYNLLRVLNKNYRQAIADSYWIDEKDLCHWVLILTNIRNISAHHSRLWNKRYVIKPRTKDRTLGHIFLKYPAGDSGTSEAVPCYFNVALIVHFLLKSINRNFSWVDDLEVLLAEHPGREKSMWFPPKAFGILRAI